MKTKKKYKKGGKFPDLNKDGKITRADILKGRGVFMGGGKFMDSLMNRRNRMKGAFGGASGALDNRRKMKAMGAKPTFKGMAKGYVSGMLGPFGGFLDKKLGNPGDESKRTNRAFTKGGRLRKY